MSAMDMFTALNNDILQCILYEWLDIKSICQLDIAVCNYSIRPLYYEALQSLTLQLYYKLLELKPFNQSFFAIKERTLYELLKWSKKREIKNPIESIFFQKSDQFLSSEEIMELSNHFITFKYIKSIALANWNPLFLQILTSLQNLTYLQFSDFPIDSSDESYLLLESVLKQLPDLECFDIASYEFEPKLISILSELPSLKQLTISDHSFSEKDIEELSKLTQLESLSLLPCLYKQRLNLSFLSTFNNLITLYLKYCTISLQDILPLTKLKELKLRNMIIESDNINFNGYLPLYQLESFDIDYININYDFLQFIFQSKQLKRFYFHNSSLQSYVFYGINNLSYLQELTLGILLVDAQLFDNICQLSQLKKLELIGNPGNINETNIQNICLPFSKLSKQLIHLYFYCQPYLKNSIEEISQLYNLSELLIYLNLENLEELQLLSKLKQLKQLMIQSNISLSDTYEEYQKRVQNILQIPKLDFQLCGGIF